MNKKCYQCNIISKSFNTHCVRCSYICIGFDTSKCMRCDCFCPTDKEKLTHNMEQHFIKSPHIMQYEDKSICSWCGKIYADEVVSNGLLMCDNCFTSYCAYTETLGNSWKRNELVKKIENSIVV